MDLLEQFLWRTDSRLIIPQIVCEEALKGYRQEIQKKLADVVGAVRALDGFVETPSGASLPTLSDEDATKAYESAFHERLKELHADIPTYSDVPSTAIASRALEERRPFRDDDKGVRDTILWETILRKVVSKDQQTVLVTNDKGFMEADSLHPHLKADLVQLGFPDTAVVLVRSLDDFNKQYVKPTLPVLQNVLHAIQDGTYAHFSLKEYLEHEWDQIEERLKDEGTKTIGDLRDYVPDLPEMEEPIELSYIEPPSIVEVLEVYKLDDNRVFIEVSIRCPATVEFFMFKGDYYMMEDDAPIEILDDDWNDHYMWAATEPFDLDITLNITLNVEKRQVDSWEVGDIAPVESFPKE